MAMAAATEMTETTQTPPSWNPLRCSGTALPAPVLLMAKLIALCLLLTNHIRLLPEPFLPFLPVFDHFDPKLFQWTLRILVVGSAAALLFNRYVRVSVLLLGSSLLLGLLSSQLHYTNHTVFCAFILLLTGLQRPGQDPWLLRYQVVIVYFGAGLNKLLDPDWRSGQFFEFWAIEVLRQPWYISAAGWFPPMALSKFMSWFTFTGELGLAAGFLAPRFYPYAIWGGILFHSGLLLFSRSPFTVFFYAMLASFLVFARWPRGSVLVLFDGDCGFCNRTKDWLAKFDFDRRFDWQPFQKGGGRVFGIAEEALQQRLHLVADGRIYTGFAAFKLLLLYNPVFYFATLVLLTRPPLAPALFRSTLVVTLLCFFSPFFSPIGEAAYHWVARNRFRIPVKDRCQVG
jgi:predicted DCC family thiol-disulfide oxidoreductase YuxK